MIMTEGQNTHILDTRNSTQEMDSGPHATSDKSIERRVYSLPKPGSEEGGDPSLS